MKKFVAVVASIENKLLQRLFTMCNNDVKRFIKNKKLP